jgi:ribosome-binding factor A
MIPNRIKRVNNLLQETISEIVHKQVKDPRVSDFVSVTEVRVSADLRTARVFVSTLGSEQDREKALAGLQRGADFIRARLRESIKLRRIPTLLFIMDDSIERGVRVSSLIDKALNKDGEPEPGSGQNSD